MPGVERRRDTVAFYARSFTPRRAVTLGWLTLTELRRRDPGVRVVAFGDSKPANDIPFAYEDAGIVAPDRLAALYSSATAGLVLSMTNYSLIPQEMLACGLPCVDLAGGSSESIFGSAGPVAFAPFDPVAMADVLQRLLRERDEWAARSQAGLAWTAERSWDRAVDAVEAGLRAALAENTPRPVGAQLGER